MKTYQVITCLTILGGAQTLVAGSLEVLVRDQKGAPVSEAVVYAQGGNAPARTNKQAVIVIDQRNKQFIPYVTALQVGTAVLFPNGDNIPACPFISPAELLGTRKSIQSGWE